MLGIDKKAIFSIKNIYLYNPYLATLKPLSTRDGVILTLSFPDNIKFLEGLLCNCNPFLCPKWGPSGPVDVQWTSIEHPHWTCGRPKGTFNGRLTDVPNETQLVRPNRTKRDVHFRPSRDAGHDT